MGRIQISNVRSQIRKGLVFKAKDLETLVRSRSRVSYLVRERLLVPIGSGYYADPELSRFESIALVVGKYFPNATLSGVAALRFHGLIDQDPEEINADIPKETSQRSHVVSFSRVSPKRLTGVETVVFKNHKVLVYNPERALVDGLLKRINPSIMKQALRNYMQRGKIKAHRIHELDREFKTKLGLELEKITFKSQNTPLPSLEDRSSAYAISEKQRLLEAAVLLYARGGAAGLDLKSLAEEGGVSLSAVNSIFPNKTELHASVMHALKSRILDTGALPLHNPSLKGREWLRTNVEAFLSMGEVNEIGYRIQKWCMAEQSKLAQDIMELSSQLLRGIADIVMAEVEGIDIKSAEARALMVIAMMDSYSNLIWYFADMFNTASTKKELIENYKKTLLSQFDDILFKPL